MNYAQLFMFFEYIFLDYENLYLIGRGLTIPLYRGKDIIVGHWHGFL